MNTLNRWLHSAAAGSLITVSSLIASQAAAQSPLLAPAPTLPNATTFKPPVYQAMPGQTTITQLPVAMPVVNAPGKDLPDAVQQGGPVTMAAPAPCAECATGFDFSKVPDVKPFPPSYNFPQPTGPGYYSFLDVLQGNCREAPPKYGYTRSAFQPPPFFTSDFRYLDDPNNTDHVWSDELKRIKFGDNWMFSTGGQAWYRYMTVNNQQLTAPHGEENLARVRTYGDLWYKDTFRFYVEMLSANTWNQGFAAGPNDVAAFDFLNLFIDVKLFDLDGHNIYGRVGKFEMPLGSQRLVSNIDFTNVRRTFEGASLIYRGENWDVDAWWARPTITNPYGPSGWDRKQDFAGAFTTYHPNKTDLIDVYYLYLANRTPVKQLGIVRGDYALNTFGSRYMGNANGFLWDFEGAMQLGSTSGANTVAGMATAGLGYNFKSAPWNPTVWAFYDYASGDHSPGKGNFDTFNQLFAFGHNFLGGMDLFGRQNLQDINAHVSLNPTKWLTFWTQYHYLRLDSATDALYGFTGNAVRRDATGKAGVDVGNELNFIFNFHVTANQDIQFGYGHLFGGNFMRATGKANVDYTYLTYNLKW